MNTITLEFTAVCLSKSPMFHQYVLEQLDRVGIPHCVIKDDSYFSNYICDYCFVNNFSDLDKARKLMRHHGQYFYDWYEKEQYFYYWYEKEGRFAKLMDDYRQWLWLNERGT